LLPSIVSITKSNKIDENQTVEFSAKAQMPIFSLDGIESLEMGSIKFIKEAARRAINNNKLGYIVVEDGKQTGRLTGVKINTLIFNRAEMFN
jgi:hypothetical protein